METPAQHSTTFTHIFGLWLVLVFDLNKSKKNKAGSKRWNTRAVRSTEELASGCRSHELATQNAMQGTSVRTRLPFCSQKEKREENAISAHLLSWDVKWEKRRQ